MEEIDSFQLTITSIRARSRLARRTAWFSVSLIIITVFLMISFFYLGDLTRAAFFEVRLNPASQIGLSAEKDSKTIEPELRKLELEVELKKAELQKSALESTTMTETIAESVAKIGAVFIAIYLVQILLSLTRYHFRIADHLEVASDILNLAGGDHEKLKDLMLVLATTHIDFGKAPTTPVDKVLDTVKDTLSKR